MSDHSDDFDRAAEEWNSMVLKSGLTDDEKTYVAGNIRGFLTSLRDKGLIPKREQ